MWVIGYGSVSVTQGKCNCKATSQIIYKAGSSQASLLTFLSLLPLLLKQLLNAHSQSVHLSPLSVWQGQSLLPLKLSASIFHFVCDTPRLQVVLEEICACPSFLMLLSLLLLSRTHPCRRGSYVLCMKCCQ